MLRTWKTAKSLLETEGDATYDDSEENDIVDGSKPDVSSTKSDDSRTTMSKQAKRMALLYLTNDVDFRSLIEKTSFASETI